ncbi:MAG: ATP-binding protein [Rhodospirillaceae bacterium]
MTVTPLPPDALYGAVDPALIPFATTAEAPEHDAPVGQDRAVEAVRFAIGMNGEGYNLFCMGPEGTGKASLVRRFLRQTVQDMPVPDDWCYVHNFVETHRPRALRLPAGRARHFAKAMDRLVEDLRHALPAAFETDEYRNKRKAIDRAFKERQDEALEGTQEKAEGKGIALVRTPVGLALAPIKDGEVLGPDEFKQLPDDEQERLKDVMGALQKELEETLRSVPRWERDKRDQIRDLDRAVTDQAVAHFIGDLRDAYDDCPKVLDYLEEVHQDILDTFAAFLPDSGEAPDGLPPFMRAEGSDARFRRYQVNVLVHHDHNGGAPMVEEDHPTQPNLVGRIEHMQQFGALVTDFNLIKPGALHRANGGFLMVEARKLLMNPFAWDDVKRALRKREVRIEAPGAAWGIWSTQSLDPEPIPLDVKVVLLGEPMVFYMLSDYDADFRELFKVVADFNVRMDRSADNTRDLALLLASMAREKQVRPLDRSAIARVIEHGARLADDQAKVVTHMSDLCDLMREAEYHARQDGGAVVTAAHVRAAIDAKRRRSDRIPLAMREEIERETIHIATTGTCIGQINGLAVIEIGPNAFGRPSRISARVRVGRGELIDIERESDLSGSIHSKGVLILTSFLSSRFAEDQPLSLTASLVFEQSYGMIDGDSASSTELYCLMSALAETPIRQGLAVTGSVDQFGKVQAIGGVNEKIEGFFDLCAARGLTGEQGVLIPASNTKHLMLREDVVDAVRNEQFHIYPVESVDQGIEILTGIPAGVRDERGDYPHGTINRLVAARLASFTRKARRHAHDGGDRHRPPPRRSSRAIDDEDDGGEE